MSAFTTQVSKRRYNQIHKHVVSHSRGSLLATGASLNPNDLQLQSAPDGISSIQVFEPIINVPAASAFLIISVVFALLQLRINAVSSAAKRRSDALETLRTVESLQLSDDSIERPNKLKVDAAKAEFENALRDELQLRTIIPGVRIVAPNDPKRDEEQRAAAKRFLGWDANEFDDENEIENKEVWLETDNKQKQLSGGAQVVLFGVASILILLLWTLSFDPMSPSGSITPLFTAK